MRFNIQKSRVAKMSQLILPAIAVVITISIIRFPEEAFQAAFEGLDVWFNIVLPALLPFFIGSQLLMGLGVVHFMGVLLEPFMRPFFNVPGAGSFVMAMGLASGYPLGAMLTGKLVKKKLCNAREAERLMSFSNTADPLFMVGAVAVGMFKDVRLGSIISVAHYISALLVGFVMRFYAVDSETTPPVTSSRSRESILLKATRELIRARREDARPFGKLLSDSIKDSINSLLLILGFITLFSVIIRIITIVGFVNMLAPGLSIILKVCGLQETLSPAIISGIFEITLGTKLASTADAPLIQRVVVASAIIAWSGLSVHFQVLSMITDTDIKILPYIIARLLHAIFAGIITYFMMAIPIEGFNSWSMPVFAIAPQSTSQSWLNIFTVSSQVFLLLFSLLILVSIIIYLLRGFEIISFKVIKK
ncbi:sporulation integral membrane protein YlbJ [Thermosediminibacter oceani]|uniref:Sporulation integral membrane protein YlbJ n=1 Tax=Thermosediminibacter oceani (strain ATCC BAA-1034 / DSM 16646 / JW/IW-1228P) TaxID=555079 RepID=D9S328_THEOJ|nr:sporulation integral membrane protein YlbJ [Thermosediminibacter oceani]ADL07805.1 sporulation integral membrane protein YlbJ [Thermosediminibacter oceani DSM 16646]